MRHAVVSDLPRSLTEQPLCLSRPSPHSLAGTRPKAPACQPFPLAGEGIRARSASGSGAIVGQQKAGRELSRSMKRPACEPLAPKPLRRQDCLREQRSWPAGRRGCRESRAPTGCAGGPELGSSANNAPVETLRTLAEPRVGRTGIRTEYRRLGNRRPAAGGPDAHCVLRRIRHRRQQDALRHWGVRRHRPHGCRQPRDGRRASASRWR